MKIVKDTIYSALVEASYIEKIAVRELLTVDESEGSFLRHDGLFYTGLVDHIKESLGDSFSIEVDDSSAKLNIHSIDISDSILEFPENPEAKLRPYQVAAARKAIFKKRGIIEAAPGAGKSEIAAAIIKYTQSHSLVDRVFFLAGTRFLMNQAANRLELRGIKGVSRFGGGNRYVSSSVQVCVIASLHRAISRERYDIIKDFSECDMIILDEVHHASAASWVSTVESCQAPYRIGLTATVWEDPAKLSHKDLYLLGLTGLPLCYISSKVLRNRGWLAEPLITLLGISHEKIEHIRGWKAIYTRGIVKHKQRNSVAVSIAKSMYNANHKVLIIVNRIKHGLILTKVLTELGCLDTYFVKGGDVLFTWKLSGRFDRGFTSIDDISEIVRDSSQCILIMTQVGDEGVDLPSVSCIVMCAAMKKYRRIIQRLGRGMRAKPGDNRVYVFDFVDETHDVLMRHSLQRIETYKAEDMEFSPSLEVTGKAAGANLNVFTGLFKWKEFRGITEEDEEY